MNKIDKNLYEELKESLTIHHESGSVTVPLYDEVKDVHDAIYNHYDIKKLIHHKNTTIGLYCFDKDINKVFLDVPKRDDAKSLEELVMIDQINYLKKIVFRLDF